MHPGHSPSSGGVCTCACRLPSEGGGHRLPPQDSLQAGDTGAGLVGSKVSPYCVWSSDCAGRDGLPRTDWFVRIPPQPWPVTGCGIILGRPVAKQRGLVCPFGRLLSDTDEAALQRFLPPLPLVLECDFLCQGIFKKHGILAVEGTSALIWLHLASE